MRVTRHIQPLDVDGLNARLLAPLSGRANVLQKVDSTNTWLRRKIREIPFSDVQGTSCLAEAQTEGRGRRGREWQSEDGTDLVLSLAWTFESFKISGLLSLFTGVAIASTLERVINKPVSLKWPNDVYVDGRKMAGILIEIERLTIDNQAVGNQTVGNQTVGNQTVGNQTVGNQTVGNQTVGNQTVTQPQDAHRRKIAVIGAGINVAAYRQGADGRVGIFDIIDHVDRTRLAASLLSTIAQALVQLDQSGPACFLSEYRSRDCLKDRQLTIKEVSGEWTGTWDGIQDDGTLAVIDDQGQRRTVAAADVSIRLAHDERF